MNVSDEGEEDLTRAEVTFEEDEVQSGLKRKVVQTKVSSARQSTSKLAEEDCVEQSSNESSELSLYKPSC